MIKLATVEKINKILPIEGADKIELAIVKAWPVVIKKGEYKVGDFVCYIVPDTVVKRASWNSFLWQDDKGIDGAKVRLKAKKFRGQLSMGLAVSVDHLKANKEEGEDVTEQLGVEKWEAPVDLRGTGAKGGFPSWLRVSDETNILGEPKAFEEIKNKNAVILIKNDGSSGKASLRGLNVGGEFQLFSRRLEVKHDGANPWSYAANKYQLEQKLRQINRELCLCFELIGPKMNGNKMGLNEIQISVYDVWDIQNQKYLDFIEWKPICDELDIPTVEILKSGAWGFQSISDLQSFIDPLKYPNGEFIEGVVVRPDVETYSPTLKNRLNWKLINSNFAVKYL